MCFWLFWEKETYLKWNRYLKLLFALKDEPHKRKNKRQRCIIHLALTVMCRQTRRGLRDRKFSTGCTILLFAF